MSNRIDALFSDFKQRGRKALIGYVTAGFPKKDSMHEIVPLLEKSGLDLLEIGVPFSDPIADGPVIQSASQKALLNGMSLPLVLDQVRLLRKQVRLPIVLMSYSNPLMAMGSEAFFQEAEKAGVDGLIIPDLIPEEGGYFAPFASRHAIRLIYLVAPTTPAQRLKEVAEATSGFLYAVSLTGVTGARKDLDRGVLNFLQRLRKVTRKPVAVGFGISKPEHVQQLREFVDGVIVGSALLNEIETSVPDRFSGAGEFISLLQKALNPFKENTYAS